MNYIHKDENAVYYECGYSCDNAIFLSLGESRFFFTDGRYEIDARINVVDAKVIIASNLIQEVVKKIKKSKIKKLLFNPQEFNYHDISSISQNTKVELKAKVNLSQQKRIIKSQDEIIKLAKAVKLGKKAFSKFSKYLTKNNKKVDEKYINYIAKNILSNSGQNHLSFAPITAISELSALPHATPTSRVLTDGDLLLFDAGVKYDRYCSDRTRTSYYHDGINFDISQKFKSKKIQKAYDTVLKAHDRAIEGIKVGMRASEIDKIARDIIEKSQFRDRFIHSTGHGVGLDIHELPVISSKSDTIIEDGMVFTIEPGVYLEDRFGIRIEDMVVIENGKAKVL